MNVNLTGSARRGRAVMIGLALASAGTLGLQAQQAVYPNVAPTGPTRALMIQPPPPGEIEALPLRGPATVQMFRDRELGLRVTDINARFGGAFACPM